MKRKEVLAFSAIFLIILIGVFSTGIIAAEEEASTVNEETEPGVSTVDSDTNANTEDNTETSDIENNLNDKGKSSGIQSPEPSSEKESFDYADTNNNLEDLEDEFNSEELDVGNGGTTPDSAFYFVDEFLDRFGNDLDIREEKIAEVKTMIEKGDIESARTALNSYRERVENLREEVDPEKRTEARRSAAAIHKSLNGIRDKIPENERAEFIDDVFEEEQGIITAVEISSKIKELCEQLAQLDPLEYEKICSVGDDAPEWQKKKHKEWTEEQKKEAAEFGSIMKECFKTSGRECRCEDITFYDFSVACEKASAYAVECDEGNEESCLALDELEMPELPEHLQDVFDEIESKEAKYEMHMPYECVEAGATTPKACSKIMIEKGAPDECKQALLDSGCDNERDCRKICDDIMFKLNAPSECVDKGIKDPKECAKLMMPSECSEKGISDPNECRRYMESFRSEFGPQDNFGGGPDCMSIPEPMERLKCFEGKMSDSSQRYGTPKDRGEVSWQCKENRIHEPSECENFMREEWPQMQEKENQGRTEEIRKRESDCAQTCERDGKAWDFSGGNCRCFGGDESQRPGDYRPPEGQRQGVSCDNCAAQCPGASGTRCGPNGCECIYEQQTPTQQNQPAPYTPPLDGTSSTSNEQTTSGSTSGESTSSTSSSSLSESSSTSTSSEPSVTGGVIFDNEFLDYWFNN